MRSLSAMLGWGQAGGPRWPAFASERRPRGAPARRAFDAGAALAASAGPSAALRLEIALTLAVLLGAAGLGAIAAANSTGSSRITAASATSPAARLRRRHGHGFGRDPYERARILCHRRHQLEIRCRSSTSPRRGRGSRPIRSSNRRACASSTQIRSSSTSSSARPTASGRRTARSAPSPPTARRSTNHDGRYGDLPFVVGEGANGRVREFAALLDAMDELKPRVEAGCWSISAGGICS